MKQICVGNAGVVLDLCNQACVRQPNALNKIHTCDSELIEEFSHKIGDEGDLEGCIMFFQIYYSTE